MFSPRSHFLRPASIFGAIAFCFICISSSVLFAQANEADAVIFGTVFDAQTGRPLGQATITLLETGASAATGFDGRYRLETSALETATLVATADGHNPTTVTNLKPLAGTESRMDVQLAQTADSSDEPVLKMEAFSVSADILENSALGVQALRKRVDVSVDAISSDMLGKYVATDISDAVIRLPGISVARGNFAVIRGLSERYNATMLDGIVLPSADPEKQTPSLDLFPTRLMDSIVVYKNFIPRLPAFAAGGTIDLQTLAFPEARYASVSFGLKAEEDVFGDGEFLSYPTYNRRDLWARGKGDRAGPPPAGAPVKITEPVTLIPRARSTPWGQKMAFSYGDTLRFREGQEFGFNLSLTYDRSLSNAFITNQVRYGRLFSDEVDRGILSQLQKQTEARASTEKVLVGGLITTAWKPSENHQIYLNLFNVFSGDDTAQLTETVLNRRLTLSPPDYLVTDYDLDYRQRSLIDGKLGGKHLFPALAQLEFNWYYAKIQAKEDQPDQRSTRVYQDTEYRFSPFLTSQDGSKTITRFWRNTTETTDLLEADLALPFGGDQFDGRFELGWQGESTEREYAEADGSGVPGIGATIPVPSALDIETRLVGYNLALARTTTSQAERTADSFFANLSGRPWSQMKIALGARLEKLNMQSSGIGRYGNQTSKEFYRSSNLFSEVDPLDPKADIQNDEILPSLAITWTPIKRLNVRAASYRNIARPSFREFGSYFTRRLDDDVLVHGNAGLQLSEVESSDLRVEYFFDGTDLVAVSAFKKTIRQPIERVRLAFGADTTESFVNNPGDADLKGTEFEFRKDLGFIAGFLQGFSLGGNYTYIEAEVPLLDRERAQLLNSFFDDSLVPTTRVLYDQPEWIANFDVTYGNSNWGTSITLSAYAMSKVLTAAPESNTLALYADARHQVDFSLAQRINDRWKVKLQAKNLTDPSIRVVYDPDYTSQRYEYSSRRDGRSYSMTATYDF